MVCPDPGTTCPDPGTRGGSDIDSAAITDFGIWSGPESDPAVLAAVEAAAREIGHNGRRRAVRRNVSNHRQRLRARGLRPVQFWLPDLRRADTQEQARDQSRAVAWSAPWGLPPPWSTPEPGAVIARGELRVLRNRAPQDPQIVAILLDNAFDELSTTLVCPLTTCLSRAPLLRVAVSPSAGNGLRVNHQLMLDGLTTVPRLQLGACLGRLSHQDLKQLGLALLVVSGLAR